jgi:type IV pilus assembly protein PilV
MRLTHNVRSLSHKGFSLVEVLVALIVLSVGMLGVAVLFVESIRTSRSAVLRTHAVNLVSDMADRIRANAGARDAYDINEYGGTPALWHCAPSEETSTGQNCDAPQLAEDDLALWLQAVRNTLPVTDHDSPMATVQYFPPAGAGQPERYRIRVAWQEPTSSPEQTAGAESYSYQSDVVLLPRR